MSNDGASRSAAGRKSPRSDVVAGEAALNWAVDRGATARVIHEVATEVRRVRRRRVCAAVGGLAALVMVGFVWQFASRAGSDIVSLGSTRSRSSAVVSLPAKRILPDGSVVELRDGTDIAVNFTDTLRRVTLLRGEAHFDVRENAKRPFVVAAQDVEARAVGTAFAVRLSGSSVEVLVTAGRVAVGKQAPPAAPTPASNRSATLPPAASSPGLVLVEAGNRVVIELAARVTTPPPVQPVAPPEMAEKLSWRVPRLDFSSTPLVDVIAMFNQYSRARVNLADPALGSLQLSGVLRADNADSLLQLLKIEFGIEADRRGENEIVLHRP